MLADPSYDTWPINFCTDFVDLDRAKYLQDLIKTDCDADCMKEGTRWSLIFLFNGLTMALLSFTYLLIAIGSRYFTTRIIGACLNCFLSCVHFATIVTTAIYRFNTKGKLAAICIAPSYFEGSDTGVIGNSWTFKKDGDLILTIWVCQLFLVLALCCLGSLPLRMSK